MAQQLMTTKAVANACDVSYARLMGWLRAGRVMCAARRGKGHRLIWTPAETAAAVKVAKELWKANEAYARRSLNHGR